MLSRVRIATRSSDRKRTFLNPPSGSPGGGGGESGGCGRSGSTSSSPGVHFEMRVEPELARLEERRTPRRPEPQPLLGAAVAASPPGRRDERGELIDRRSRAERAAQVDTFRGIETEVPEAVGREPAAVARP